MANISANKCSSRTLAFSVNSCYASLYSNISVGFLPSVVACCSVICSFQMPSIHWNFYCFHSFVSCPLLCDLLCPPLCSMFPLLCSMLCTPLCNMLCPPLCKMVMPSTIVNPIVHRPVHGSLS